MLSFDASLSNALKLKNTTAFWVLKLYYNAEGSSDFIGVSDIDRSDGSDMYYGLVSSWGSYSQSLDFFSFTTTTGNMSVRLINTDRSIKGGRFSDLFSTNNFANRKWELFLNTAQAGTYDTAARMIGTGIISGDIKYDYKSINLALLDNSNSAHNQVPINVVEVATHTNSPKGNIDKPIPIFYGDCSADTTALASGTSGNFDHHFVKGKFPAIITDKWNVSQAQVFARPDDVTVNDLDDFNIFSYKDGYYFQVNDANADVSAANARVDFSGVDWRVFVPLAAHNTDGDVGNFGNTVDGDLTTYGTLGGAGKGYEVDAWWRVPKVPNLGTIASIYFVIHYKDFTPDAGGTGIDINSFRVAINSVSLANVEDLTWGTGAGSQAVDLTSGWTTAELEAWNLEEIVQLELNAGADTSTQHELQIFQVGLEVRFSPSQTFVKEIKDYYEITSRETQSHVDYKEQKGAEGMALTKKVSRTRTVTTPDVGEYLYVSGKGREYGAWIDTINSAVRTNANGDEPDPNYASGALIENPVYMIEDILRRELGLDGSTTGIDIDVESFDRAGNAQTDSTKGDIALLFNDAIADIKFAFSQYKFINSKDLITKICRQCMSFVFFSGSGKFKIKTLLLPSSTWGLEETIDFSEINIKNIGRTSLNNVRNKIIINYAEDYARDKMMESTTATDSTSTGTTVDGFGDTLTLELDADCILDSTTADNLRNAYKSHYKDRKVIIDFDIVSPKYNDLEITDFISFSNWDANLKLYGTAFSSDVFIIQSISKKVNGCSISALKVD